MQQTVHSIEFILGSREGVLFWEIICKIKKRWVNLTRTWTVAVWVEQDLEVKREENHQHVWGDKSTRGCQAEKNSEESLRQEQWKNQVNEKIRRKVYPKQLIVIDKIRETSHDKDSKFSYSFFHSFTLLFIRFYKDKKKLYIINLNSPLLK